MAANERQCHFCGTIVHDGRAESGASTADWCDISGDFGCERSPLTDEDGAGPHAVTPEERDAQLAEATRTAPMVYIFKLIDSGWYVRCVRPRGPSNLEIHQALAYQHGQFYGPYPTLQAATVAHKLQGHC